MNRYFIRRILETIPLMLVISIFVFMFIHLIPGDPARTIAGLDAEESEVQAIREEYDLDKPLVIQYVKYMGKLFHGNMGQSMKSGTPVTELILTRMKTTLKLVFAGILWAPALGIFIGVISAIKRGKALDHACMFLAISGLSAPGFWLGLMGIQIFSVQLGWLPSGGLDSWKGMVLPSFTMGCSIMAVLARYSRSSIRIVFLELCPAGSGVRKGIPKREEIGACTSLCTAVCDHHRGGGTVLRDLHGNDRDGVPVYLRARYCNCKEFIWKISGKGRQTEFKQHG